MSVYVAIHVSIFNNLVHFLATDSTLSLGYLYEHITPRYAADWKVIGTLLGLPNAELKIIDASHPNDPRRCCNTMLEKWLEVDPNASWSKLNMVIQSPAMSSTFINSNTI